jgi:hypothetical protein
MIVACTLVVATSKYCPSANRSRAVSSDVPEPMTCVDGSPLKRHVA